MPALDELTAAWAAAAADPGSPSRARRACSTDYVGRPSPLGFAARLSADVARAGKNVRIYLKREDLCHTGAHKINNCIGQVLLARRMGKTRIIAETGAGQHGVATATACALFGLPCEVYMGAEDVERQAPERLPHEAARREGPPGRARHAHAQGRDERGAARLGHQRARHALPDRIGRRAAPVPDAGARPPVRDRPRGARADPGARRAGCPTRWSRASAAAPTRSGCFAPFVADPKVRSVRRRGGRRRASTPGATRRRWRGGGVGVLHGARVVRARATRRADRGGALDHRRPRLPGRRPRARVHEGHRPRAATCRSPTRRRWRGFSAWRGPRGSCARSRPRTRSRRCAEVAAGLFDGAIIIVSLSGRGDKDMVTIANARSA